MTFPAKGIHTYGLLFNLFALSELFYRLSVFNLLTFIATDSYLSDRAGRKQVFTDENPII